MKFLIFSDLHSFQKSNLDYIKEDFEIIIFLGDIKATNIYYILNYFPDKKAYGILGNHDDERVFLSVNHLISINKIYCCREYIFRNINLKKILLADGNYCLSFAGIQGAYKYNMSMVGYTQEESEYLNIPKADILFSHDTGYGYMKRIDKVHIGLKGIDEYLKKSHPKYHIFGHYHQDVFFIKYDTDCYCVYGCSIFDTQKGMKKIF